MIDQDAWFELGAQAFAANQIAPAQLPPLGDRLAQRWWLAGFAAAWAEAGIASGSPATAHPGSEPATSPAEITVPDARDRHRLSTMDALVVALAAYPVLRAELRQHGAARAITVRH